MSIPSYFLNQYLQIFAWYDIAEILFFSAIFYAFSLWLQADNTKRLLPFFYGYGLTIFVAHFLELTSISTFMLMYAPVALTLFVVVHQRTLQKNLVSLRSITPVRTASTHNTSWVTELIRSMLHAVNMHCVVTCIIEVDDSLEGWITVPAELNAPVSHHLLEVLIKNSMKQSDHVTILLSQSGTIKGIPAQWGKTPDTHFVHTSAHNAPHEQHIAYCCNNTDALIVTTEPEQRLFTIYHAKQVIRNNAPPMAVSLINRYFTHHVTGETGETRSVQTAP